jgi:hypothetical protein
MLVCNKYETGLYSGVCYNKQFLSVKSGIYNERGEILFINESSIIVFNMERFFYAFHVY